MKRCYDCRNHLISLYIDDGDYMDYCAITGEWVLTSQDACKDFEQGRRCCCG